MPGFLLALGLAVSPAINLEAVLACMNIEDDRARLACYDVQLGRQPAPPPAPQASVGSAAKLPAAPAAAPPPAPAAAQASAVPSSPEADFGLTAEQRDARQSGARKNEKAKRIEAQVVSAQMTASGRLLLMLDNGQQWLQIEPSQRQLFFVGDPIIIKKAALSSFLASGPKSGTGMRVRRVQ